MCPMDSSGISTNLKVVALSERKLGYVLPVRDTIAHLKRLV